MVCAQALSPGCARKIRSVAGSVSEARERRGGKILTNTGDIAAHDKRNFYSSRPTTILLWVLIGQLCLALILRFCQAKYQPIDAASRLFACDFNSCSVVTIEAMNAGAEKVRSKLVLRKDQHGWVMPDYYGAPAATASVNQLFVILKSLKKGFPVTTTPDAIERFNVSPVNFDHSITLSGASSGGLTKDLTLYLGASSSPKTVYARLSDNNDVYSVEIPEYIVSTKGGDWFDKSLFQINPTEVTCLDAGRFKFQVAKDKWTLAVDGRERDIPKEKAVRIINRLAFMNIGPILGIKEIPEYNADHPVLICKIAFKKASPVTYSFSKPKDKGYDVLKVSDKDYYVAVDDAIVKDLQEVPQLQ
jgi:hypothetical protein